MSFEISLATPADDAEIRALLAANPVPGRVAVTYERDPDYFAGCRIAGGDYQVLLAREQGSGELAGVGCRAVREAWVNGEAGRVGYLSGLRVDRRFRGRWLVGRGLRALRELDAADPGTNVYLAAVTEENREALGVLVERPRPGFPLFRELDRVYTAAIAVRKQLVIRPAQGVRRAVPGDLPEIVRFLNEQGRELQFSPRYAVEDFRGPATLGFETEDFLVAIDDGRIRGAIGLWNQSHFKQTVVRSYSGALRRVRPFLNVAARLTRRRPLPAPGEALDSAYASFVHVDDPHVFRALLRAVHNLAAKRGHAFLLVGLTESDPLLAEVRRYPHVPYRSRLYTVCWTGSDLHARLDGRRTYVDIATL